MRIDGFNRDQLIAIYGLLQVELKRDALLDGYGAPKKRRNPSEANSDAIGLYKWLAEKLRSVSENAINERKDVFNTIVKSLNQEYLLNMALMTIFMMEYMVGKDGNNAQKITLMPKINRLVKHLRAGIIAEQGEGLRIVKDSKIGASNVMQIFNGGVEITKEMRAWKADRWRKAVKAHDEKSSQVA